MALAIFDTHKLIKRFVERLTAEGMEQKLATALAEEVAEGLSAVRTNPDAVSQAEFREHKAEAKAEVKSLATKQDVSDLRSDMDVRFAEVNGELKVLKWMGTTLLAGVAALLGIAIKMLLTH